MRVLIADDHILIRDALRSLLEAHSVEIVGEAGNGREAVALAHIHRPDVVLMDLMMPELGGLQATRLISAERPEVKVGGLTAPEEDADLFEAIKSGAQGYLLKNVASREFFRVLEGVVRGEPSITTGLARKLVRDFAQFTPAREPSSAMLTDREWEVLTLLAQGVTSNRELAERLVVGESTVKYHLHNILVKLHLRNRAQVVAYAHQHGLVNRSKSS